MKTYEYVFNAPKELVIEKIISGVSKPSMLELREKDVIYGKIKSDKIILYHGIQYGNSFRPIFSAKFTGEENTMLKGIWRLPIFAYIFFFIWCLNLIFIIISSTKNFMYCGLFFLFPFVLMGFSVLIEKKRMAKVISYIEEVQRELSGIK